MINFEKPKLINIPKHKSEDIGFLSVIESKIIPGFDIKRVYWTYEVPEMAIRGHHAHKECVQILFCLKGKIVVNTELPDGDKDTFVLDEPTKGLILWPHVWHFMSYHNNPVQIVLASHEYIESDYLRSKEGFFNYYKNY